MKTAILIVFAACGTIVSTLLPTGTTPEPLALVEPESPPMVEPQPEQVIPINDNETPQNNDQQLDRMESILNQLVSGQTDIKNATTQVANIQSKTLDRLEAMQKADEKNAGAIVSAIENSKPDIESVLNSIADKLTETTAKAVEPVSEDQFETRIETRYRTEYRQQCFNGQCQMVEVSVPYQVEVKVNRSSGETRDVIPIDDGTGPPMDSPPMDGGGGCDCGCGIAGCNCGMSNSSNIRRGTLSNRTDARFIWFPRWRQFKQGQASARMETGYLFPNAWWNRNR